MSRKTNTDTASLFDMTDTLAPAPLLDTQFDQEVKIEEASTPRIFPKRAAPEPRIISGWWKSWNPALTGQAIPPPLPTLNHNAADQHVYTKTQFLLADGLSVEQYPLSGSLGIRVPGEPELVSLYSVFQRDLVQEVTK